MFVLSVNRGTCASVLIASIGSSKQAFRVALAHTLFKVFGTILMLLFLKPFVIFVNWLTPDIPRQIAWAHSFFNIAVVIMFLPFIQYYSKLVYLIIPKPNESKDKKISEIEFVPKYLDAKVLQTPEVAMGQATREVYRIADIVYDMLRDTIYVFAKDNDEMRLAVKVLDDRVDLLSEKTILYLTRLIEEELTEEQSAREMELLYSVNQLEYIGDIISHTLMSLARKKIEGEVSFSEEGWKEVQELYNSVKETFRMTFAAFSTSDQKLAEQVIFAHERVLDTYNEYYRAHIARLHKGVPETIESSTIHLDIIHALEQIDFQSSCIARAIRHEI